MTKHFMDLQRKRHTVLNIERNINYSKKQIEKEVNETILLSPTAFNNKSVKSIVLTGQENINFWKNGLDILLSENKFSETASKISYKFLECFSDGKGTILFFTDMSVITDENSYTELFNWCEQNHAIAEYAVWLMLTELDLAASLQHYTFPLQKKLREKLGIPDTWMLRAEMPFGSRPA